MAVTKTSSRAWRRIAACYPNTKFRKFSKKLKVAFEKSPNSVIVLKNRQKQTVVHFKALSSSTNIKPVSVLTVSKSRSMKTLNFANITPVNDLCYSFRFKLPPNEFQSMNSVTKKRWFGCFPIRKNIPFFLKICYKLLFILTQLTLPWILQGRLNFWWAEFKQLFRGRNNNADVTTRWGAQQKRQFCELCYDYQMTWCWLSASGIIKSSSLILVLFDSSSNTPR